MKKLTTLTEALDLIQELDYVPGVSMVVPDFNYTVNKRGNFDTEESGEDFPYDERGEGISGGPQSAQGDGQQGVGRGGVGWGGRPDHSGGIRKPSAAYTSTWDHTDEGADWDETKRHGGDRRNLWRDTPDGKVLHKQTDQQEEIPESAWAGLDEFIDEGPFANRVKKFAAGVALAGSMMGAPGMAQAAEPQGQQQVQQAQYKNIRPGEARMYQKMGLSDEQIKKELDWIGSASLRRATANLISKSKKLPMKDMGKGKSYGHGTFKQGKLVQGESMGAPMQTGPVAPMDGPSMQTARGYGTGSLEDPMPSNQDMNNGPGNMWGGPGTIPGTSRSWAGSPTLGDDPNNVWKIPKESNMKLKEFFDPKPIETEPLTNQGQDYLNDATDDELEDRVNPGQDEETPHMSAGMFQGADEDDEGLEDPAGEVQDPEGEEEEGSFAGRYGGETIMMMPNIGRGVDFVMSPDRFGSARGTYGMHMDGKDKGQADMLDKRSAWDVLQHVITAMAKSVSAPPEKPENEENTDFPG